MQSQVCLCHRFRYLLCLFLALVLSFPVVAGASVQYTTTKVSPTEFDSYLSDLNNGGRVAYTFFDGNDSDIMTYKSGVFDQLTNNTVGDYNPRLNAAGTTVWEGDDSKDIFLYDLATDTVKNISNTSATSDYNPQINNKGAVVWQGYDDVGKDYDIFLYQDGIVQNISENYNKNDDYAPRINELNQVVWYGYDGTDNEIYLYSNGTVKNISNNSYDDSSPEINDKGRVVWQGYDTVGMDYDIFYYNGTSYTDISQNNDFNDYNPKINLNNQVVWNGSSKNTGYYDIFRWDNNVVTNLSNTPNFNDYNPVINKWGMVAWYGYDGHDADIYLYYGTKVQVSKNYAYYDYSPLINDRGQIAWTQTGGAFKSAVMLATPQADTYTFKYTYGSGKDYYTGTVSAHPLVEYYLGYRFSKKNETGATGYYEITGFDYVGDFSQYGQVYVDKYYDAESNKTFTPKHQGQAVGNFHLGSEVDYVGVDGVQDYKFGQGYYEADVYDKYKFRYTYGNGDWYEGFVYREPGYVYYKGYKLAKKNELGQTGYYEITQASLSKETAKYKKVYVNTYHDGESSQNFTPLNSALPAGSAFLTSEVGYIISKTTAHYFGQGYDEADK